MKLTINGESHDCTSPLTLSGLIDQMGMKHDRVAVELNRSIVPREQWQHTHLSDGDHLEIVQFVGGGCGVNHKTELSDAGLPRFPKPFDRELL